MPGWKLGIAVLVVAAALGAQPVDVQEIVRKAAANMQADWAAAPDFAFVQRDMITSKGVTTRKTHRVFMIAGSDYYLPIAIEDQPSPEDQQKQEIQKLRQEVDRRNRETPEDAQRRSEQYRKLREQNGILLSEFTKAFDFTFVGEETINTHEVYALDARPHPGYRPPNRTAKILTGMRGRLWVDKASLHWVKAEAEALKSVSVFGVFAKVSPGTRMELEMTPVNDSVWLMSRLLLDLRISILWWKSSKTTESIFSQYEPAGVALAQALAPRDSGAGP